MKEVLEGECQYNEMNNADIRKMTFLFPQLFKLCSSFQLSNLSYLSKLCKAWKELERAGKLERSHVIFWLGIAGFAFQLFPALSSATKLYKDFSKVESWKELESSTKYKKVRIFLVSIQSAIK